MNKGYRLLTLSIEVDRHDQSGQPMVRGVPCTTIADRWQDGGTVGEIASDFGLLVHEVTEAIVFEAGRAWAAHGRKAWNRE